MIQLTTDSMNRIFPKAPDEVISAFVNKQDVLTKAGINQTTNRLGFLFANLQAETGGFTIRNLTENIYYTADRMAQVWPNRFSSAQAVRNKYGTAQGWQLKAFDDIYGNRMGNRPGTHDGSAYIGRGGPQVTGRDGYRAVGERVGLDLVNNPEQACDYSLQPEICAGFWTWKGMNQFADDNDFLGCVKRWNGGTNGLAERRAALARFLPILKSL